MNKYTHMNTVILIKQFGISKFNNKMNSSLKYILNFNNGLKFNKLCISLF